MVSDCEALQPGFCCPEPDRCNTTASTRPSPSGAETLPTPQAASGKPPTPLPPSPDFLAVEAIPYWSSGSTTAEVA